MSAVNGSGLNGGRFNGAVDSVAGKFESAENELLSLFSDKGATQTQIMEKQLLYQKAQVRLQSLQEVIRNSFQTLRDIVRNGMSIRWAKIFWTHKYTHLFLDFDLDQKILIGES